MIFRPSSTSTIISETINSLSILSAVAEAVTSMSLTVIIIALVVGVSVGAGWVWRVRVACVGCVYIVLYMY